MGCGGENVGIGAEFQGQVPGGDLGVRISRDHSPSSLGIQSLKAKEDKPSFTELGEELGELGEI